MSKQATFRIDSEQNIWKTLIEETLDKAKAQGATQAEVGLGVSKGLSVTVRLGEIETVEFHQDRSFGITVYAGQQKGSASTNDLSRASIEQTLSAALRIARYAEPDPCAGLADKADLAKEIPDLDLYHPEVLTPEAVSVWAKECEDAAREADKRICNSEGASFGQSENYRLYGNTHGFLAGCPSSSYSLSCAVVAKDAQGGMQRDHDYTVSRVLQALKKPRVVGIEATDKAVRRLSPQKITTGRFPVVFSADIASGLFASFASAISGGSLYRHASFLLNKIHQPIFPAWLSIKERPHIKRLLGSAPFDSEGVATVDRDIVKAGILETYLLSSYSARKLGLKTTGHAGGLHNWFVSTTCPDLASVLKTMDKGVYVTELMGFGVNGVTGDYSQGIAGFWVENGHIQYPIQEVTIASNLAEMFKQIVAIGGDIDTRRNIQTGSVLIESMTVAGN
ncbi:MAG: PmbA protein [Pseudomonadota bacterium]|jgi:PmbA protein